MCMQTGRKLAVAEFRPAALSGAWTWKASARLRYRGVANSGDVEPGTSERAAENFYA